MHMPVCLHVLSLARSFSRGGFGDGWLNTNFQCTTRCFCELPAAYFTGCSFPPQASLMCCSTVSTPAASWRGCDIEIPGALFPLLTWSRSDFGGEGAALGLAGSPEATVALELLQVLNIRGGSGRAAATCVVNIWVREHRGCLLTQLPDTWWLGWRCSGCRSGRDRPHPHGSAQSPGLCETAHKVSAKHEFNRLSDLTTSF